MKKLLLIVSDMLAAVSMNAQEAPKGLNINDKAPEFTAKDQDGKTISLKEQD
jgi:hypothetical protein